MEKSRARTITGWILSVLLAAAFAMASLGKLTGAATEMFVGWGYATWFATVIGVLEALGAVGLVVPKTRSYAAMGLSGIMLGATYTHVSNSEGGQVIRPLLFLVVLVVIWWLQRNPARSSA